MSLRAVAAEQGTSGVRELGMGSIVMGDLRVPVPDGEKTRDVFAAHVKLNRDVVSNEEETVGRCSLAVQGGTLYGILPAIPSAASLWFSTQLSRLKVSSEGSNGILKKRPVAIRIEGEGFRCEFSDVDKHPDGPRGLHSSLGAANVDEQRRQG